MEGEFSDRVKALVAKRSQAARSKEEQLEAEARRAVNDILLLMEEQSTTVAYVTYKGPWNATVSVTLKALGMGFEPVTRRVMNPSTHDDYEVIDGYKVWLLKK